MPHLQFNINIKVSPSQKKKFFEFVKKEFSKIMKTGTDHIAISLKEFQKDELHLGRAKNLESVCLMNLDIRVGRSEDQKRQLAKNYINGINKMFGIKKENQYLTYTSHEGIDFNLFEKSLESWKQNDDPLKKR